MSNIIKITDLSIPELDIYSRLSEVQLYHINEPEQGVFIAESPRVIERALDAGYSPISFLVEQKHIDGQAHDVLSRFNDIPIYTADFQVLTQLTGFKLTRGMLCAMRRRQLPTVEQVCRGARRIAVLENVMNPTNVGAIFRSAAALNVDAMLLTHACSDPLYRRAIRVSMGTVFQLPWTYLHTDIYKNNENNKETSNPHQSWIQSLKNLGFKTAAMALKDDSYSIDSEEIMAQDKLAIVLGTEGEGLEPQTISACDYTIKIPMSHGVDSLNVAAASAVAFWQLCKC